MLGSCSSNAILTKVRAIFGQRLTPSDYAQMARKKDVGEVAAYLKEHSSYQKALRNIRETEVHRGQLEALLKKDTFYKYAALRRFDFSGNDFYDFILIQLEINEILARISTINSGSQNAFIVDLPSYLIQHTSFSMKALAEADSYDKLLHCLEGTPYHKILSKLEHESKAQIDSLRCEYVLYSYYYQYLFRSIDQHFSGKLRSQLRDILHCEIDARNVETIFRLRLIYGKTPEEIGRYLYPFTGALKSDNMRAMMEQQDAGAMMNASGLFKNMPERKDLPEGFVELLTHDYRYRFEKKKLRFATDAPVAMYTFLALRRIEVENIITVIEGVRYQIPQDEILSLLIQ